MNRLFPSKFFLVLPVTILIVALFPTVGGAETPSIYTPKDAPQPLPPLPTPQQYDWHRQELQFFIHFGINTFTGSSWGSGNENPDLFQPTALDCDQWARVAKENGFTRMTFTAKHHDGFCLWPSEHTEHSVKNSSWRGGKGDVVGEFVKACRKYGLGVGIYLSPWDRHDSRYTTEAYNDYYIAQINELFDRYGKIDSFWLDLAFGDKRGYSQPFDWQRIYDAVYRRNPFCTIEMGGPDIGWIGNEAGFADGTCWNLCEVPVRNVSNALPGTLPVAYVGHPQPAAEHIGEHPGYKATPALRYLPKLGDSSCRKGWFWKEGESKGPGWWITTYFNTVGKGSSMMFNFAPDKRGLFPEEDVKGAEALHAMIRRTFAKDLAAGSKAGADSTWKSRKGYGPENVIDGDPVTYWSAAEGTTSGVLELRFSKPKTFNLIVLQEPVFMGQRVKKYRIEYRDDAGWHPFSEGTTIGYKKIDRHPDVSASAVRLSIEDSRAYPLISTFGVHRCPVPVERSNEKKTGTREEKSL